MPLPPSAAALQPRPCIRCHERKPPEAFSVGKSGKRRSTVCDACAEAERAELEARRLERRATWEHRGRLVRRCSRCGQVKDLRREFYVQHPDAPESQMDHWHYQCRTCSVERVKKVTQRQMRDPAKAARIRARRTKRARLYKQRNRERMREAQREARRRMMADPVRHARHLEARRMAHRLKREREGTPVEGLRRGRSGPVLNVEGEQMRSLPAAPLAAALERLIAREQRSMNGHAPPEEATRARICARLGVDDRSLRAWRSGGDREAVRFDVVDRFLTRSGLSWWDVYDESYPEARARAEAVFG